MTDLQTASYLLINGFHWYLYGRLLTLFLGQRRVGCPAEAAEIGRASCRERV